MSTTAAVFRSKQVAKQILPKPFLVFSLIIIFNFSKQTSKQSDRTKVEQQLRIIMKTTESK